MPARTRTRRRTPAPVTASLEKLGQRVRKARADAGLSQAQLGQPHFTRAYVSAVELGKIRPAMKSLEFLAAKLGKSVAYFVEDEEQERKRREREMDIAAAGSLLTRATAAEALSRITRLLEEGNSPQEICRLRLMAGTAHNFLAQGVDALRELTAAERISSSLADHEIHRNVRHQTAIALRTVGEAARAKALLTDLLSELESKNADRISRMKLLKDLGAVCWDLGEYEKASAYYESALEWAKDIGDVAGLVAIYNGLAYARRALGDTEGATSYLQRALGATQVSNDLAAAAILHNALAVLASERGHSEAALRHVDRAIELARVTGPESYVSHYLNTKAESLLKAGRSTDAGSTARESLVVAKRTGNERGAAAALLVMAEVLRRDGAFDEAIAQLEEAARKYRELGAKQELGEVLMRLSGIATERGDAVSAKAYAERAYHATKTKSGLMGR
jgi:tetratricopeptide (TPR) repeat protein